MGPGLVSEALSVVPVELGLLDGRYECHDEFDCGLWVSHAFDIVLFEAEKLFVVGCVEPCVCGAWFSHVLRHV